MSNTKQNFAQLANEIIGKSAQFSRGAWYTGQVLFTRLSIQDGEIFSSNTAFEVDITISETPKNQGFDSNRKPIPGVLGTSPHTLTLFVTGPGFRNKALFTNITVTFDQQREFNALDEEDQIEWLGTNVFGSKEIHLYNGIVESLPVVEDSQFSEYAKKLSIGSMKTYVSKAKAGSTTYTHDISGDDKDAQKAFYEYYTNLIK